MPASWSESWTPASGPRAPVRGLDRPRPSPARLPGCVLHRRGLGGRLMHQQAGRRALVRERLRGGQPAQRVLPVPPRRHRTRHPDGVDRRRQRGSLRAPPRATDGHLRRRGTAGAAGGLQGVLERTGPARRRVRDGRPGDRDRPGHPRPGRRPQPRSHRTVIVRHRRTSPPGRHRARHRRGRRRRQRRRRRLRRAPVPLGAHGGRRDGRSPPRPGRSAVRRGPRRGHGIVPVGRAGPTGRRRRGRGERRRGAPPHDSAVPAAWTPLVLAAPSSCASVAASAAW